MNEVNRSASASPFDLDQPELYARWRVAKLASQPRCVDDLIVDVADPRQLSQTEHANILALCARCNMAVYRSPVTEQDKTLVPRLGAQLGLHRLDANWLADEDGISQIAVSQEEAGASRTDFIPYTDQPIKWHTDGYYHPQSRRIEGMILHCVRAAGQGGVSGLVDHEMLYIALRDTNPDWVRALMANDAMTIPERTHAQGVARAAQGGPVFYLRPDGGLQMRYTARTRSIAWKDDPLTHAATAELNRLLNSAAPWVFHLLLAPGMGIVANNVPHARSGFSEASDQTRLLYRARYLDHVSAQTHATPHSTLPEALAS